MNAPAPDADDTHLTLQSRDSELARVFGWIERLGERHEIPTTTQFAMNLCLEEVLSNIIRHGYAEEPGHTIEVRYSPRPQGWLLVVEDRAAPFNPLTVPDPPPPDSLRGILVGGQGIRLVRHFAQSVEYERTATGNRLALGFSARERLA